MQWSKKELLAVLSTYEDTDILVGELWSKLDVEYALSEIASDAEYEGVTQEQIDSFDVDAFWDDFSGTMDDSFEHNVSYNNSELYVAILDSIKGCKDD